MGNGRSRDASDVAALRQGLELIGRWALLLARKSPQLIDRWEHLEERLQTAEVDLDNVQGSIGTLTERLARLEDREKTRETRVAALETSVEKALSSMFPRVDALLTHLEQQNNASGNKVDNVSENNCVKEESSKTLPVSVAPVVGNKRKHRQKEKDKTDHPTISNDGFECSPKMTKRLATDQSVPSKSTSPESSPIPSTSSSSPVSQHHDDLEDALLSAVVNGNLTDLNFVLAAGADVNIVNVYGQTPVALAASRGYTDCLSALLVAGGFVNSEARDLDGQLAIHAAAFEGQVETLKLLISAGADVNARTEPAAHTPLMLAALRDHHEFVSLLLQSGANVNLQDTLGETALHKATKNGSNGSITLLIDAGANVNLLDETGHSPLSAMHFQGRKTKNRVKSTCGRKIS